MQIDRLFQIVYTLLRQDIVTAKALAERLGVTERTIRRDIDALSLAGVPVYTSRGRGGGISLLPGYSLPGSLLTEREQQDILSALQGISAIGGGAQQALEKLSALFGAPQQDWIRTDFSDWNGVDDGKFELLKAGILERRVVEFFYYGSNAVASPRRVEPTQLWFKHRSWYLAAWDLGKQAPRLFRLSRIQQPVLTEQHFPLRDMPAQQMQAEPQQHAPPYVTFLLRIDAEEAYRVYDEFHSDHARLQADGSFLATMHCPADSWIFGYILSFGAHAELLEPACYRQVIQAQAEKIFQRYQ